MDLGTCVYNVGYIIAAECLLHDLQFYSLFLFWMHSSSAPSWFNCCIQSVLRPTPDWVSGISIISCTVSRNEMFSEKLLSSSFQCMSFGRELSLQLRCTATFLGLPLRNMDTIYPLHPPPNPLPASNHSRSSSSTWSWATIMLIAFHMLSFVNWIVDNTANITNRCFSIIANEAFLNLPLIACMRT